MNKVNFLAKETFPQSTYTFDFMQNMIKMVGCLALLGGDNFILTGCVDGGNGVFSEGLVVIKGQLYPFAGGAKKAKIKIQETKESDHYAGVDYPEAYIHRKVIFSDDGDILWDDLKHVLTNREIAEKFADLKGDAPGTVKMWAGQEVSVPQDYRLCNGAMLSIDDYPELWKTLGLSFGGDGQRSFALPDLRGRFVVGYDGSKPDYKVIGKDGIGGNEKVTLTTNEIPQHDHVNNKYFNKLAARAADATTPGTAGSVDSRSPESEYNIAYMSNDEWEAATIQKVGGGQSHENRPPYFVLAYIIKVK